jgi:glycosyltransferase involved in cell wall biosynthesis
VPNTVDVDRYRPGPDAPPPDPRAPSLLFPAMFGHVPNAVAAEFLMGQLLPRLRARWPACRLLLVGAMPTPAMLRAADADPNLVVTGAVPDVRPYLAAASAVAVPLFEGSGTRLKILEAFAAGVPVVSTAQGAEGICAAHEVHLLIAEDADAFAAAVARLVDDLELAGRLSRNALELVTRAYSWDAARRSIADAVRALPHAAGSES